MNRTITIIVDGHMYRYWNLNDEMAEIIIEQLKARGTEYTLSGGLPNDTDHASVEDVRRAMGG